MTYKHPPLRIFSRFLLWRKRNVSEEAYLVALAVATGLVTGLAAFILKRLIAAVSTPIANSFHASSANYALLFLPLLGILLTGIFQRYIIHRKIYHGTHRMQKALAQKKYRLPSILMIAPMLGCTLTLGFGGSAGSEGPIAYTGAAIGSNIGRGMRLSPPLMKVMLACGASAGIAGIFKAPLGGALFSLEVLCVSLTAIAVVALLSASITAALTAYLLSGCTPDLLFPDAPAFSTSAIPWVVLLGLFCGLYSAYYSTVMSRLEHFFESIGNPWIKNTISGLILSALVFLFPMLFGEGYQFMTRLLSGNPVDPSAYSLFASDSGPWTLILIFGGVLVAKAFACCSTNSGGGVAGDFAPTLFAGCIAGFFFAALLNQVCGTGISMCQFAFFGMAAVMAGAIRAPLMAIFITVEMTQTYTLLLPVVIAAVVSYSVVRLIHNIQLPQKRS